MTKPQALNKLSELMKSGNLIKHCLAVEAAMCAYAEYFDISNDEQQKWAIAGLLHDADYEKFPQEHPQVIIQWLREQNANKELINAVAAHGFCFNIAAETLMAKTLRAVDELTGLIVAVALVRPNKKLSEVSVESVLNKWNSTSFAAGVNRDDIERGAKEINVPLKEHISIVLEAMQGISDKLGL
ncbi:HAD family hydrolase [Patescibacteria group bacterium]|nr:HAD family hydrolase [Patescibacteria group bacterium]